MIVCTVVGSWTLTGLVVTPSKGIHWVTKLVCKTLIPISLGNFYLFSCSKYVALKAGLINTTVAEGDDDSQGRVK